jgi:hypothetical protein
MNKEQNQSKFISNKRKMTMNRKATSNTGMNQEEETAKEDISDCNISYACKYMERL